jgi:hypothetical protein
VLNIIPSQFEYASSIYQFIIQICPRLLLQNLMHANNKPSQLADALGGLENCASIENLFVKNRTSYEKHFITRLAQPHVDITRSITRNTTPPHPAAPAERS